MVYLSNFATIHCELKLAQKTQALIIIFCLIFSKLNAQKADSIRVGLDLGNSPRLTVATREGKHCVIVGRDTVHCLRPDDGFLLEARGDSLLLRGLHYRDTVVRQCRIVGLGHAPVLHIQAGNVQKDLPDEILVRARNGKLNTIARVMLDRYVAYVVHAEAGASAGMEYHRIQAVMCRTYALRNWNRHARDGYEMCDKQHCQVFDPSRTPPFALTEASASTSGLIMVDGTGRPIDAAFHANCGGQTANSEEVWSRSVTYLRSVVDTFCLSGRSATWQLEVPLNQFKNALRRMGHTKADPCAKEWVLTIDRPKKLNMNGEEVSLIELRKELGLRSAWFGLRCDGDKVYLNGRGFGHGVGLCQQGAIGMAKAGYDYKKILGYFYQGTKLIDLHSVHHSLQR